MHEIVHISDVSVVTLDVAEALERVHSISLISIGCNLVVLANDDIQSNLGMVINLLFTTLDGRCQVSIPNSTAIHAHDSIGPDLVREYSRKRRRGDDSLHWVTRRLIENVVVTCNNVHTRNGDFSLNFVIELFKDRFQESRARRVIENA